MKRVCASIVLVAWGFGTSAALCGEEPVSQAGPVVKEFVGGKIKFKNDSGGIIHAPMGKKSFAKEQLVENIRAFIQHVTGLRPVSSKGIFLRKISIKTTMSPSSPVDTGS